MTNCNIGEEHYGGFDFDAHVAYWRKPEHSFHGDSRETFLYFIADGRAIKIGTSDDPSDRLRLVQVCNPRELKLLGAIRCPLGVESALHQHFHNEHIRGEWFRRSPRVKRLIRDLIALERERSDKEWVPGGRTYEEAERLARQLIYGRSFAKSRGAA